MFFSKGHIIYLCCLVNHITGFAASSDFYLFHFCFDCTPSVFRYNCWKTDQTAQDCRRSITHTHIQIFNLHCVCYCGFYKMLSVGHCRTSVQIQESLRSTWTCNTCDKQSEHEGGALIVVMQLPVVFSLQHAILMKIDFPCPSPEPQPIESRTTSRGRAKFGTYYRIYLQEIRLFPSYSFLFLLLLLVLTTSTVEPRVNVEVKY